MQIDGHHTGTYVCARIAGFSHEEAEVVAYAAQYVDDATNAGPICFKDSEYIYSRIASAHKMLDASNFSDIEDNLSWLPFHFLPGNEGQSCDLGQSCGELEKLACRPDSPVARDMLRSAMQDRGSPRGLHRLGIAMRVFADTFTHQGFVGSLCKANAATELTCGDCGLDKAISGSSTQEGLREVLAARGKMIWRLLSQMTSLMVKEKKWPGRFLWDFFKREPVGHAAVKSYPDQPFIAWSYRDWKGQVVRRDNVATFLDAFDAMTRAMRAWRAGDEAMDLAAHQGLTDGQREELRRLLTGCRDPDGEARHARWLEAIHAGHFSFGSVVLSYVDKGEGSWKHLALGTEREKDTGFEKFPYTPGFLSSHWKLFHDALQVHRSEVLHEILPGYGICAG